jgi:S1-C subfamily serine protease
MAKQEAVVWYRKAAEQGFAKAQTALGRCYANGVGVAQDYGEAVVWYRKAAEQGEPGAQRNLGVRYESGTGVAQNCVEAVKWYRKAAEQGEAEAQYNLGECYWVGHGVQQDYPEAVKWYRKAAEEGDADAQCFLGECYWRGRGVQQNYQEAVKWFRKALKQGSELARTDLAQAEAQHYPRRDDPTQRSAAEAAAAQRRAVDANWFKDVSKGGTTKIIWGPHEVPLPDTPTPEAPRPPTRTPEIAGWQGCTGTGFFVTDDGYFVTCEHVVRGAASFHIRSPSGSLPARLIKKDRTIDVAVLKVDGAFRALPVAAQPLVNLGEAVFTIGFPNPVVQGVEPKLTRGEISSMSGIRDNPRYYQISVPVQPGNSGGALLDECGNAVGVVTSRLDDLATYQESGALPQNVNYAVKGGLVYDFLNGVPELSGKLNAPRTGKDREAASAAAERAAVLVVAE